MHNFEGYLTVTDLDGTLIDSKQAISQQNIDAIDNYVMSGGLFAVATGRTEINVLPFIKDLNINCPCILYNGAIIYDVNKQDFVKCVFLKNSFLLEPLKEMLKAHKEMCMMIFTPGKMYIASEKMTDPSVISENQPYEFKRMEDIAEKSWIKILLYDTNLNLIYVQNYLNNNVPPGILSSVFSTSTYLELLPYGVSKGSALLDLIDIVKVKRGKVIAIGDYCNDIEMIQVAGLGVATENAHPLLKEAANLISVSNDEHIIHHLIKNIIPNY